MEYVIFEKRNNIGILTINRPKAFNALNSDVLRELCDAADMIEADADVRVLVVTGAGKAFVAGADIAEMSELSAQEAKEFCMKGQAALSRLEGLEIPVIAAINGYALGGGCELALCCDIRLASEKAKMGQPETGLGITPGFGGTQRLPRVIGVPYAMQLILTGAQIDAQEAKRIGLVNEVYPAEKLMDKTLEMANRIVENAPVAIRQAKAAIRQRTRRRLSQELEYEADAFASCFNTNDQKMAMRAFVNKEKRDEFKGE